MSNHSQDIDPEMSALMGLDGKDEIKKAMLDHLEANIGPTGKTPEGQLTKKDDGELTFAVGIVDKKVVIKFGTPVDWFGMLPNQAKSLGELLIERANEVTNSQFK